MIVQLTVGSTALVLGLIMTKLCYDWWSTISEMISEAIAYGQHKRIKRLFDRAMYAEMATGLSITWCLYSAFVVVMAVLEHFGMADPLW